MTHTEMLKSMIAAYESMQDAKVKYYSHPGGGASQQIKNKLAADFRQKEQELSNLVFNVKQFIK